MLIPAKVKATQQMFLVGIDMGTDANPTWRDPASPLQNERWYAGNLLDGEVGETHYVQYSVVEWRRFKGDELEEVPGDHRLLPIRLRKE
jgi:hypothetical protein